MAVFMPHKPDHEGLQPAYNLRAGNGLEAPQVVCDRTEFKELTVPNVEERSRDTGIITNANSSDSVRDGSFARSSSHGGSFNSGSALRPDSDPRSNGYCGEKVPGWGLSRPWWKQWWAIAGFVLVLLIVVAAAITTPLMLLLRNKNNSNNSFPETVYPAPQSPQSQSKSTSGTYIGTGIGANDIGDPTIVYFQHFDADLWETAANGQDFVGKILDAGSIRNGSALAAISYLDGDQHFYRHVVYLDPHDILHDVLQQEGSGNWNQGVLGNAGFRASSSPTVGLSFIGIQTEDTTIPTFPMGSLRIYYGGQDGRVHEVSLNGGDSEWKETYLFPNDVNGNAGIYVGQPWFTTNLICSTTKGELTFYNQLSRPIEQGTWTPGTSSGITVTDGSAVGMALDYVVYYQDTKNAIRAVEFNPNRTDASAWGPVHFIDNAVPNTRLIGMSVGWDTTPAVIYQNQSNSLTQAMGQNFHNVETWNHTAVPVEL